MSDMSIFKLSARTINPDVIPRSFELLLPGDDAVDLDADPNRAERFTLGLARFPIRIHVASCVDFCRPTPPPGSNDMPPAQDSPHFPQVDSTP